jgi:hypothetical protein
MGWTSCPGGSAEGAVGTLRLLHTGWTGGGQSPTQNVYDPPVARFLSPTFQNCQTVMSVRNCARCGRGGVRGSGRRYCDPCRQELRRGSVSHLNPAAAQRKLQRDRIRAATFSRGYGNEHQKLRKRWTPKVERGDVNCARCGKPIDPGSPWDLGHDDQDRSRYSGPEHRRCNRGAPSRKRAGAAVRTTERKTSRRW